MSGFAIFNIDIKKPEEYKEYVEKVKPIAEKFGGEYIVRGGETKVLEGTWTYPRTVVIKFPSYEKALEWYNSDEYKPVKQIRLENSVGNGIIIQCANKIWDIHPLIPIIEAAGGVVSNWKNESAVKAGNILVSANRSIHNKFLKILKPISK